MLVRDVLTAGFELHPDQEANRQSLGAVGPRKKCCLTAEVRAARFDIKTGAVMGPPAGREVRSYPVRVTGPDIEIEV